MTFLSWGRHRSSTTLLPPRSGRVRQMTTLGALRVRTSARRQRGAQLRAGRDPELREHAVEVRADGAVRQVQPLADLAVRQAPRRQLRDLQLLRGELVARFGNPAATALARGTQL